MSLLSLCHAMAMSDLFLAALILVYNLVFLVNESNLNCIVAIVFNSLDLSYNTRASLKHCYRRQCSVFAEDLSHSDFCR